MTTHALSVDVENWYDTNLGEISPVEVEDSRVVPETMRVLEVLQEHSTHATFFILGKVAERHPSLVRSIADAGHEIACHSYEHRLVCRLSPEEFAEQLRRARGLLQDVSGQPVLGFRAPTWSITREALPWAPKVILEAGFAYDSSVFPMRTHLYGIAGAPRSPWRHQLPDGRSLLELPPSVFSKGPLVLPIGGGAYWRFLPSWLIRRLVLSQRTAGVYYLHPWEAFPADAIPAGRVHLLERFLMSFGKDRPGPLLASLLGSVRFAPIAQVYANQLREEVGL